MERITTIERCGTRPLTFSFPARRLSASERLMNKTLPYISTDRNKIEIKQIGEMTGLLDNWPIVENAQILFAVDMDAMPPKDSIMTIQSAFLKMGVRKISSDFSKDTELLCLLNRNICSGVLFRHASWKSNINNEFLGENKVVNSYFTDQYLTQPIFRYKNKDIFAGDLIIDLKKIIEDSDIRDLKSIFYDVESQSAETQYFVVADDTYISNDVYLELVVVADQCH